MGVSLPSSPAPAKITPRPARVGFDLGDTVVQRINRMGDRFAFDIAMPKMERAEGEVWVSRLLSSFGSSAVMDYPQPYGGRGDAGAPLVNGAGQAGMILNVDGVTPDFVFPEGPLFSLFTGGRRYCHVITGTPAANASGQAALTFWPMLRVSPANNAVIEYAQPKIEGLIGGDQGSWTIDVAQHIGLVFTITESR